MNAGEEHVRRILDYAGLALVAVNHAVRGADGSVEGEVDLVYAHENYVLAIEVSGPPHSGMRRRRGRALKEWDAGALLERLSSGLGLPAADSLRTVHVSLPWRVKEGEEPRDAYGGKRMGEGHMDELDEGPPARARSVFLEWNGIPHDAETGRVLRLEAGAEKARGAGSRRRPRAGRRRPRAAPEAVRTAALESNARLRLLIGDVYARNRAILGWEGAGAARGQASITPWERRLLSVRHLVLELWAFEDACNAHYWGAMGGLEAPERDGLRMIMDDHEGTRVMLRRMRKGPAGRMEHDYGEFTGEASQVGLASIVLYARVAYMLQDAVCRAIPSGGNHGALAQERVVWPPRLPTDAHMRDLEHRHASLRPVEGMEVPGCARVRDLQMSLRTTYAMFGAVAPERGAAQGRRAWPTGIAHMARCAVLDIHGFIEEFGRLGIKCAGTGMLSRKALYARLHDGHVTHSRANRLAGTAELLGDSPDLFSFILPDMVEADFLASRILGGFPDIAREVVPMTEEDIAWTDRSMECAWTWGGLRHGHGYADPNAEQACAARPA